jgi:hypothetical protein
VNYDQPRERADRSGWHYTQMNDGRVWPIGYCADHAPHATEGEARDCYTRYLLEQRLQLDGMAYADMQRPCEVCGAWTDKFAEISPWGPSFTLCDEHRTREQFAALFGQVGDSVHS